MALVTCNGVAVIDGTIIRPLGGVWTADLKLDQLDGTGFSAGTKVKIESDNGYALSGVVVPALTGDFLESVYVSIVGGAGGMAKDVLARSYVQPGAFVRDVLNGLATDSGETLSGSIDAGFLATNLAAWATKAEPTSYALGTLLGIVAPSYNWRILGDGTLWCGAETWPDADVDGIVIDQDPSNGSYLIGLDSPALEPGTTVAGIGQVSLVKIAISPDEIRARVWNPASDPDRGTSVATAAMALQATAHVDYYARYEVEVRGQSSDLTTVDVSLTQANAAKLAGLDRVPFRSGTGVKVQLATGSRLLLGWDAGDPRRPYVSDGLPTDTAQAIQLAGTTPIARKGDEVDGGTLYFVPGTGGAALVWVPPGTPPVPPPPGTAIALQYGTIHSGSSIVKAG